MLTWLLVLALAPAAAPLAQEAQPETADRAGPLDAAALAARDARVAFSDDSATRARAVLVSAPEAVEERAIAALALAAAGASGDLPRLESMLADGQPLERRAALFALGDMGAEAWPALERALLRDTRGLEDALIVALQVAAESGLESARAQLAELAQGRDERGRFARAALEPTPEGAARPLGLAQAQRFELRWRAAKAYGLVDGKRWQKALASAWFEDEEFLDRVVLESARELPLEALQAHLLEILLTEGERLGALRVAAILLPQELARAHQVGGMPLSLQAWRAVLEEIDQRRAERACRALTELAFRESSELEPLAGVLILRAGGDLPWSWVANQLERGSVRQRVRLLEACGERGDPKLVNELADLLERRPAPELVGAGLLALARLGHPPAKKTLEGLADSPPSAERASMLAALPAVLHDRGLQRYALVALAREDLTLEERIHLELGLAQNGARIGRDKLRGALPLALGHEERLMLVRALGAKPEPADLDALAELFPVEDDADLNVELALTLLAHRHAATRGLLPTALWKDSWNRSVLAGGLIYHRMGSRALMEEINAPPRSASERDLRRVGFALGEWGGLGAVEELARTHEEGKPALQGAFLGALSARAAQTAAPTKVRLPATFQGFQEGGAQGPAGGGKAPPKGARKKPRG